MNVAEAGMMLLLNVVLVAVASVTHLTEAYPFEVAKAACEDMMPKGPGHQSVSAQSSKVVSCRYCYQPKLICLVAQIHWFVLSVKKKGGLGLTRRG